MKRLLAKKKLFSKNKPLTLRFKFDVLPFLSIKIQVKTDTPESLQNATLDYRYILY